MMRNHFTGAFFAAAWLAFAMANGVLGAELPTPEWLRGAGGDLQIRLHGEVLESDGRPATKASVACNLNNNGRQTRLETVIDRNHFEVWIPVNASGSFSLWLKAASSGGERVAFQRLSAYELRQAAVDGITLKLASPTREKRFLVTYQGQPVADTNVKVELGYGAEDRTETSADGIATFGLLPEQEITQVTVWTDDRRVGGFSFDRGPTRDPRDDQFTVELSRCRDQLLRFVDESGDPVPNAESTIQIATPSPDYNYLGTNENSRLQSDSRGEVVYRWFPDWERHHCYVDLTTPGWVLVTDEPETSGDALVFRLKKSASRKSVRGQVDTKDTAPGGFFVSLRSFQGEREDYSDIVSTFTNPDGSFEVTVLPDARYCAWVLDSFWVSEIIDLIPYSSALDRINSPQLSVVAGQEIEVFATLGPEQKPYSSLGIYFRRDHDYEWLEDGETRSGTTGPQFWAITDEHGHATARTAPGPMRVSVYSPKWRTEQEVTVRRGMPTQVRLHRESSEPRPVAGRLTLAPGLDIRPEDVDLQVASVDGQNNDEHRPACRPDGTFSFETLATEVGVYASARDGSAAGAQIATNLSTPIELELRPTLEYEGQLLDDKDRPLADHSLVAEVRLENRDDALSPFSKSFTARRVETRTDSEGNFTLRGLPSLVAIQIFSDSLDGSSDLQLHEEFLLQPGERRPRTVLRMPSAVERRSEIPLAERYPTTLRDCALGGYRPLVILFGGEQDIAEFVHEHLVDQGNNGEVSGFMQILVDCAEDRLTDADADFVAKHSWQKPAPLHLVAYAQNDDGEELGKLDIDIRDSSAMEQAANFIHRHAPPTADAEEKWAAAFDEARRTNRRVWARVSGRHCGPCFRLSRWLDDQHELLEKDYVFVKIDDARDENGKAVAKRIVLDERLSIPFSVIFDQDEKPLVNSVGPLGNIGFPGGSVEGERHLRKMLVETRRTLTDGEIAQLVQSVSK